MTFYNRRLVTTRELKTIAWSLLPCYAPNCMDQLGCCLVEGLVPECHVVQGGIVYVPQISLQQSPDNKWHALQYG
jgi:hypothetical protein